MAPRACCTTIVQLKESGFTRPIMVKSTAGTGLSAPSAKYFGFNAVQDALGDAMPLEVIDVRRGQCCTLHILRFYGFAPGYIPSGRARLDTGEVCSSLNTTQPQGRSRVKCNFIGVQPNTLA